MRVYRVFSNLQIRSGGIVMIEKKVPAIFAEFLNHLGNFTLADNLLNRSTIRARFFMKERFSKVFGTVWLSLLLAYSGIAWAFAECSLDGDESAIDLLTSGNRAKASALDAVAPAIDKPIGTIHCVADSRVFDVIAQTLSNTAVKKPLGAVRLVSFQSNSSTSIDGAGRFGRHPALGWFIGSSPPPPLSRHILLSVLLI